MSPAARTRMAVPRNTNRKLGLAIKRFTACIARIPSAGPRESKAFIMKVEKEIKRPAIMPLPRHDNMSIPLSNPSVSSITLNF